MIPLPPTAMSSFTRKILHTPHSSRTFTSSSSRAQPLTTKPLHGTVSSHRSYILFHTPEPPSAYPAKISSSVQRALQLKAMKWGGIVNFGYLESRRKEATDGRTPVTAFSTFGQRLEIPDISEKNVDEVEQLLLNHAEGALADGTPGLVTGTEKLQIYVCTHGERDCRCGEIGGNVAKALREEIQKRIVADPESPARRIEIGEVGHVGQHYLAANVLVFPHGEWLGLVKPEHAESLIDNVLQLAPPSSSDLLRRTPLLPKHWRGRMGLNKDEQLHLISCHS